MAARTPCLRRCSTINTTSPSQQGVEGTNSRSGLDTHRRISDTGHVYLLVRKNLSSSLQRRHILRPFATGYLSLRNSWALQAALGYQLAQGLFIAKRQLIVEGLIDLWLLKALDHALIVQGRMGGRATLDGGRRLEEKRIHSNLWICKQTQNK